MLLEKLDTPLSKWGLLAGRYIEGCVNTSRHSNQDGEYVPLLKHIHLLVFTDRQEFSLCHYLKLQLGIILGEA